MSRPDEKVRRKVVTFIRGSGGFSIHWRSIKKASKVNIFQFASTRFVISIVPFCCRRTQWYHHRDPHGIVEAGMGRGKMP